MSARRVRTQSSRRTGVSWNVRPREALLIRADEIEWRRRVVWVIIKKTRLTGYDNVFFY
jgi:hypothetical protein